MFIEANLHRSNYSTRCRYPSQKLHRNCYSAGLIKFMIFPRFKFASFHWIYLFIFFTAFVFRSSLAEDAATVQTDSDSENLVNITAEQQKMLETTNDFVKNVKRLFPGDDRTQEDAIIGDMIGGGFIPDPKLGTCPDGYHIVNGLCWIKGSEYEIKIQNKYMQDYDGVNEEMNSIDIHRVAFNVWTGANHLTGNVPVMNCTMTIWHDGEQPIDIILPNKKLKLESYEKLNLTTNVMGRAFFSVLVPENKNDHKTVFDFDLPIFRVHAPFMEGPDVLAFEVNTQALSKLSNLNAADIRENLLKDCDDETAEATVKSIKQLIEPVLHGDIEEIEGRSRLKKRSLLDLFDEPAKCQTPYFEPSNLIVPHLVYRSSKLKRKFGKVPNSIHWEVRFGDMDWDGKSSAVFVEHDDNSVALRKRDLIHVKKRAFFDRLGRKIKKSLSSAKDMIVSTFVDVPRSLFNVSAMRQGKLEYLQNVRTAISDMTEDGLVAGRDFVDVLPFGERLNYYLGIDELVDEVEQSDGIIITPLTYGLEVVILGPQKATSTLINSMKKLGAIIKGILKRVGIAIREIFKFILSLFNWGDILVNHRVLRSHYSKMLPFIRRTITNRRGNITTDLGQMVDRISEVSQEATELFVSGNFSSMADLIARANKEIYRNMTSNPKLDQESSNGPVDLQASYLSDHFADGVQNIDADISDNQKQDYLSRIQQMADGFEDLFKSDTSNIKKEIETLKKLLRAPKWDFSKIFGALVGILTESFQILLTKAVQVLLVFFDILLSLINEILSIRIRIPFLTSLYEKIIVRNTGEFSLYDLFCLSATTPLTIGFKIFNDGRNLFTGQEAEVLIATENPEFYIDNLVAFAMQVPNQNSTTLRLMYRQTVSYLLGSGYASGQLLGATVGYLTESNFVFYLLRAPPEFLSMMANYPWSWYLERLTEVGINIRFLSWLVQFFGFVFGWLAKWPDGGVFSIGSWIVFLGSAVPNIIMIVRVWLLDLRIIGGEYEQYAYGYTSLDVTMKGIARMINVLPHLFSIIPYFESNIKTYLAVRTFTMTAAQIQNARLYLDIPTGGIYSV